MKMKYAPLAAALLLSACASSGPAGGPVASAPSQPGPAPDAFRTADFQWSTAPGRGSIEGEVGYSEKGVRYSCAQGGVVLTPETPWVKQRMRILYRSDTAATLPAQEVRNRTPPERSQDYSTFVRRTSCDAEGLFRITGLPDGSWFLITVIRPRDGSAGREMAAMRRVSVSNGRAVKLKL